MPSQPSDLVIRPAEEADVPLILSFIRELADFEKLADRLSATEERLRRTLFGPRPAAEGVRAPRRGHRTPGGGGGKPPGRGGSVMPPVRPPSRNRGSSLPPLPTQFSARGGSAPRAGRDGCPPQPERSEPSCAASDGR